MSRTLQLIGLAVIGVACVVPIEARAAMALCEQLHAGEVAEDKSELVAKQRALESWLSQARKYGEQYTRWASRGTGSSTARARTPAPFAARPSVVPVRSIKSPWRVPSACGEAHPIRIRNQ